jgi:hypothetical protein
MIKRTAAVLISAGLMLAGGAAASVSASAITIPSPPTCSSTDPGVAPNLADATNQLGPPALPPHCWYLPESGTTESPGGAAAGYVGADDNHTHYRFIRTTFTVTPQMIDLNGSTITALQGAVGVEECDPNIAYAAQFGVVWDTADGPAHWVPFYAQGFWNTLTGDPCINHNLLVPHPNITICPPNGAGSVLGTSPAVFCGSFSNTTINTGDVLADVGIYYTPGHIHSGESCSYSSAVPGCVSFGFENVTQGYSRQAYGSRAVDLNFWEVGVGVFSGNQLLGAPAGITLVSFTNTGMNCYSCSPGPRPLSVIQPVNDSGVGGLEEVQDVNGSNQVVLSPDNTLVGGSFTMFNGSTSP